LNFLFYIFLPHLFSNRAHCRKQPKVKQLILAEMEPERAHRRPTKEERGKKADNVSFTSYGDAASYTMKRLKRDRPDLFEQVLT
jgi:hypothetical protein